VTTCLIVGLLATCAGLRPTTPAEAAAILAPRAVQPAWYGTALGPVAHVVPWSPPPPPPPPPAPWSVTTWVPRWGGPPATWFTAPGGRTVPSGNVRRGRRK
jgi:hypothetical protein